MKFLKWVGIIVLAIIVIVLIVAALLPGEYRVERSIVIDAKPEVIYEQVVDLNNWEKWSPWQEMEPGADFGVSGSGRGVGSVLSWKGEIVGTGNLTIMEVQEPTMIKSRLVFLDPMEAESDDIWTFEPGAGGTEVTWAEEGELGYPLERFFGLGMDSMLGGDMEKGLEKLKRYLETMPEEAPELIDGAVPEDKVDPTAVRPGEQEVGNPDVRYEHKPYEEAVKESKETDAKRVEKPLKKANRVPPN